MLLLNMKSHPTAKAVAEWSLISSHSISVAGQVQEVTLLIDRFKSASEHDLSAVLPDGVKLLMNMWSLYTVVFLSTLLPGKSC